MRFRSKTDVRAALRERLDPAFFKALGDPTRLELVCRLAVAGHPLRVSDLTDCCGVHLSGVSRHLAILERAGVVTSRRSGREVRYQLAFEDVVASLRALDGALEACRGTREAVAAGPGGTRSR